MRLPHLYPVILFYNPNVTLITKAFFKTHKDDPQALLNKFREIFIYQVLHSLLKLPPPLLSATLSRRLIRALVLGTSTQDTGPGLGM